MINIVTIDPSLTCTAVTVNGEPSVFATDNVATTKTGAYKSWFEKTTDAAEIFRADDLFQSKGHNYSDLEVVKLQSFTLTVNAIIEHIDISLDPNYNTVCLIEGYSYSSAAGPLIDLVTFGTTLRASLQNIPGLHLVVLAPSTVKRLAAKLTYPPIQKGKKIEY